jgi:long-subunit acyl-CoA synthetase (AMP-forming)
MDITLEKQSNKFLKEHNCKSKIVKGYGMTEVTGGVSGTVDNNNEIGSVGIPFVKTTISIFEPGTENELGYNDDGEVCITGPNTMLGYFENQEATDEIIKRHSDGKLWVHTGDIGHINENGSLFIVDRIKRMMIRYDGFKIFPSIIENVIGSHKAVEACKVVALTHQAIEEVIRPGMTTAELDELVEKGNEKQKEFLDRFISSALYENTNCVGVGIKDMTIIDCIRFRIMFGLVGDYRIEFESVGEVILD